MKTDEKIAREWAEGVVGADVYSFAQHAAARFILDTTTPPTMADVEWDAAEHAGLCAEHSDYGLVRMLSRIGNVIECFLKDGSTPLLLFDDLTPIPGTRVDLTPRRPDNSDGDSDGDSDTSQIIIDGSPSINDAPRPEDMPVGEAWEVESASKRFIGVRNDPGTSFPWIIAGLDTPHMEWVTDKDITPLRPLVPETTPEHPKALTIEADYRDAPGGTVVADEVEEAWTKNTDGLWETYGVIAGYSNYGMAGVSRQVLRWGWAA